MNTRSTLAVAGLSALLAGCATTPRSTLSPADSAAATVATVPQDYSPESMYTSEHGDFIAKMDRFRPDFKAQFKLLPDGSLDGEPGDFDMTNFLVDGRTSLILDPDGTFLVGGRAERRYYNFNSMRGLQDETLASFGLDLGWGHFFDDDTYGYASFRPGVYSDFDGSLKGGDWQFMGDLHAVYRYQDNLFFRGGLRASRDFEKLPVFPVAGLSWLMTEDWRLDMLLPVNIEVSYAPETATTVFTGLGIDGDEYYVRSPSSTGKIARHWNIQEITAYFGAEHRLSDNLSIHGRAAFVVGGDYKLINAFGAPVEGQLDPGVTFELGAGWTF